jgi:pyruvate/2-oxoglutarate dehydrogenase complex dihydrolipoamide dehydrogenase (E3) component
LSLNGESITCRNTVIATGSHPFVPEIEGLEETGYLTNEDVFDLLRVPRSIIVVGGGPVGVELGQAFERLGASVTIIQGPDRILPREDLEVSATLGEMALAMQHNLSLDDILDTIHVYPTLNTGIQQAAYEAYLEGPKAASNRKIVRTILSLRR